MIDTNELVCTSPRCRCALRYVCTSFCTRSAIESRLCKEPWLGNFKHGAEDLADTDRGQGQWDRLQDSERFSNIQQPCPLHCQILWFSSIVIHPILLLLDFLSKLTEYSSVCLCACVPLWLSDYYKQDVCVLSLILLSFCCLHCLVACTELRPHRCHEPRRDQLAWRPTVQCTEDHLNVFKPFTCPSFLTTNLLNRLNRQLRIIIGSLVRKLPSFGRMSRGSLVTMAASCQHHPVNNIVSKSSSCVGAVEEYGSGTREFTGENTLGRETIAFFRVKQLLGSPK